MDAFEFYKTLLAEIAANFNTLDMSKIMSCFTDDVVVHYNDLTIVGARDLKAFLEPRYADLDNYCLEKKLRLVSGQSIGAEVRAEYTKKSSGERVVVRIHEFLDFDERKIKRWDYIGHVTVV